MAVCQKILLVEDSKGSQLIVRVALRDEYKLLVVESVDAGLVTMSSLLIPIRRSKVVST